jgi:hypothetical protein
MLVKIIGNTTKQESLLDVNIWLSSDYKIKKSLGLLYMLYLRLK